MAQGIESLTFVTIAVRPHRDPGIENHPPERQEEIVPLGLATDCPARPNDHWGNREKMIPLPGWSRVTD